jgi:predicted O-methyltransferase YrrM
MIQKIKQLIRPYFINYIAREIPLHWTQKNESTQLVQWFGGATSVKPPVSRFCTLIEKRAILTNAQGEKPLWEGYQGAAKTTRSSNQVRTQPSMGNLFTHLVTLKKPQFTVEFGTAFGISGMYFLAGMEMNQQGQLLTFDPNDVWANLAKDNLSKISQRYQLTIGTFEENIEKVLPRGASIDLAFIDAIHTREFVMPQMEIVLKYSQPGTIIIFDDINFSQNMRDCWNDVAKDSRFSATVSCGDRVGVVEVN